MRPFLIVTSDPFVEIRLQVRDRGIELLAEGKAEGKAAMKKCGALIPLTALDGALSCAYLDAEIDRRCLARCAMLDAGPTPARPSS